MEVPPSGVLRLREDPAVQPVRRGPLNSPGVEGLRPAGAPPPFSRCTALVPYDEKKWAVVPYKG